MARYFSFSRQSGSHTTSAAVLPRTEFCLVLCFHIHFGLHLLLVFPFGLPPFRCLVFSSTFASFPARPCVLLLGLGKSFQRQYRRHRIELGILLFELGALILAQAHRSPHL